MRFEGPNFESQDRDATGDRNSVTKIFMKKKAVFIVGNGLSIDLLDRSSLEKTACDLRNFFKHGDRVPVPPQLVETNFLSQKYLPYLWEAGARPNTSKEDSDEIFESLVSLASIAKNYRHLDFPSFNKCFYPYQDLLYFIRYKMIYYNRLAEDKIDYENWPWIKFIKDLSVDHSITIINYNYDIWLEQALTINKIPFYRAPIEKRKDAGQLEVIKPHGSIDQKQQLRILKEINFPLKGLIIDNQSNITEIIPQGNLDEIVQQVDLIPPMGSSNDGRVDTFCNWSNAAHEAALTACKNALHVVFAGLSYYFPDRAELNDLFRHLPGQVKFDLINPKPSKVLVNILKTLYADYHYFKSIDELT